MLTIRQAPRRIASSVRLGGLRRLVDADRRGHRLLQGGQAVEVIGRHRLLEHQQVVAVELAEDVEVGDGVRGVGVDHQGDVAEMLADRADEVDVVARLDLDLDPAISLGHMRVDRLDQVDDRRIEADRQPRVDPAEHGVSRGAQHLGQRLVARVAEQVPAGGLGPRDREPAPRPRPGQLGDLLDRRERSADQAGRDPIGQVVPAPLRRVGRIAEPRRHRRALADPFPVARRQGHEDRVLDGDLARRDPERFLQGDLEMGQCDPLDHAGHGQSSARTLPAHPLV